MAFKYSLLVFTSNACVRVHVIVSGMNRGPILALHEALMRMQCILNAFPNV
jgi:hypothetical protein